MKLGVPAPGGVSDVLVNERASATPARPRRFAKGPRARERGPERARDVGTYRLRPLHEWMAKAIMDDEAPDDEVARVVLSSRTMSSRDRLDVYRRGYRARLVECLADDYPVLQQALGDETFEELCLTYIEQHPSRSPNLNSFGKYMASFCRARQEPWAAFSADLAALEWAMVEVLHAATAERLSLDELAGVPAASWAGAKLRPSDTVRIFEFDYPVGAYFQAVRDGESPALPAASWSSTAVFRDGPTIWRMDLSRAMHGLLRLLFDGRPLGDAIDELVSAGLATDELAPRIMLWFRDWVGHGVFKSIDLAPPKTLATNE